MVSDQGKGFYVFLLITENTDADEKHYTFISEHVKEAIKWQSVIMVIVLTTVGNGSPPRGEGQSTEEMTSLVYIARVMLKTASL
jgi:hypothetical protein